MTPSPDLVSMSLKTVEDVEDLVTGTNLLSGGGGSPKEALAHLRETLIDGANVGVAVHRRARRRRPGDLGVLPGRDRSGKLA